MKIQAIKEAIGRFARDEEGLTIVEYAVAGGLITVAVITVFTDLGTAIKDEMQKIVDAIKA